MTTGCDEAFYQAAYDDVAAHSRGPLNHYAEIGRFEGRIPSAGELHRRREIVAPSFDAPYYRAQLPAAACGIDPLLHYLLHGAREGRDASPELSSDYYLRRYPDVAAAALDPLEHFVVYGRREGRVPRFDSDEWIRTGERVYDPSKPTIALASHDASRTGAPFVALALVAALAERYNVVVALGGGGALEDRFRALSVAIVIGKATPLDAESLLVAMRRRYGVFAMVLNSAETSEYATAALHVGIPSVALVHEFAEYVMPEGKLTGVVEAADVVVVASDLIRESLDRQVILHRLAAPNNVVVRHQGRPLIPPGDAGADLSSQDLCDLLGISERSAVRVVLGAGTIAMRKGVDIFVQTASEVRRLYGDAVRFVWVGEHGADTDYRFWLDETVRKLDLAALVAFVPPQSDLRTVFAFADVFFLPSRLDPYPNVVIEALFAGKPVVCFEDATSFASELRAAEGLGRVARYGDVAEAARCIVELFALGGALAPKHLQSLAQRYDFAAYATFVEHQIWRACSLRMRTNEAAERVLACGSFDASFHDGTECVRSVPELRRACLAYAARGVKGLSALNPRPGFHEGYYRSQEPSSALPPEPSLIRALDRGAGLAPATHRCVILEPGLPAVRPPRRIAVHLHLHYAGLAAEFAERFAQCALTADLCITTTSRPARTAIQRAFRTYAGGSAEVLIVPNRGRDVGPLLTAARTVLDGGRYDVFAHLHGKRSLDAGSATGDRWRRYLLDTLLGDASQWTRIAGLFAEDARLGLVFPEDRRSHGWTKNLPFAQELALRLEPVPALPPFPIFPLGTMFWARPEALRPLWNLELRASDLPPEPLPYDGSTIHAIEQMLPAICEAAGLLWCTVYRPPLAW